MFIKSHSANLEITMLLYLSSCEATSVRFEDSSKQFTSKARRVRKYLRKFRLRKQNQHNLHNRAQKKYCVICCTEKKNTTLVCSLRENIVPGGKFCHVMFTESRGHFNQSTSALLLSIIIWAEHLQLN